MLAMCVQNCKELIERLKQRCKFIAYCTFPLFAVWRRAISQICFALDRVDVALKLLYVLKLCCTKDVNWKCDKIEALNVTRNDRAYAINKVFRMTGEIVLILKLIVRSCICWNVVLSASKFWLKVSESSVSFLKLRSEVNWRRECELQLVTRRLSQTTLWSWFRDLLGVLLSSVALLESTRYIFFQHEHWSGRLEDIYQESWAERVPIML